MQISVIIPTHNPRLDYLQRVLNGLREQTLALTEWELIIVDNASATPLAPQLMLDWHPHGRVVREERVGLTAARLAGFAEAQGDILVLVDDDNVLAPNFLAETAAIGRTYPAIGTWSGRVELVFEAGSAIVPLAWRSYLTERRCERALWSNDPDHHASTPWGAGMCLRQAVASGYRRRSEADPDLHRLDLQGTQLLYGGDTDIAYFGCSLGLGKGVFPQLSVKHLIPPQRCERAYLLRVIEGHAYSEYLHHWVQHKAVPRESMGAVGRLKDLLRIFVASRDVRATLLARRRGHIRATRDLRKSS